jgi:hypothetical protein
MSEKWDGVDHYIELGPCPDEERLATVGSDLQRQQASIWKDQLERTFGPPPVDSRYKIKTLSHSGGLYYEVYLIYNGYDDMCNDYAADVQDNLPVVWDGQALQLVNSYKNDETASYVESIESDAVISWDDLAPVINEDALPVGADLGTALQQQPIADKADDAAKQQEMQSKLAKQEADRKAAEEKKQKQQVDPIRNKMKSEFDKLMDNTAKVNDALKSNTDIGQGLTNLNQDMQRILGMFKV